MGLKIEIHGNGEQLLCLGLAIDDKGGAMMTPITQLRLSQAPILSQCNNLTFTSFSHVCYAWSSMMNDPPPNDAFGEDWPAPKTH